MRNVKKLFFCAGIGAMMLSACQSGEITQLTTSGLDIADFDSTVQGKKTELVVLKNQNGMEACLTNYGGRLVSLCVPDKDGKMTDVVLGYDNIAQYADTLNSPSDYGSSVGRYANRIKDAKIVVAGKEYKLRANDNVNSLHGGGNTGWLNKVYDIQSRTDSSVVFAITAPDGENGFPGTVKATATYTVKSDNTLDIVFQATTDKETVVNMTNHAYFNLNGDFSKDGFNQVMYINADNFTPSDALYIPTGEIKSVEGTPMDFITGIFMEVFTNEPGLQAYTGNFQGTGIACKHGVKYPKHVSVCFESQKYPDSPTKYTAKTKGWEISNPYLKPGEKYYSHLAYKFSVK